MCRRAKVGQPSASRKDAAATTGPTVQREPGSHHAVIVSAASAMTVNVPTPAGTRLEAKVSRRTPRLVAVRERVGGCGEVITLPWSHMSVLDEAVAARAGNFPRRRAGIATGTGALVSSERGAPISAAVPVAKRGGSGLVVAGCAVAHALCGLIHAAPECGRGAGGRRVVGHAGPVCPGLQTLPLRAAFAPTGAFGSACFVVSARRCAGLELRTSAHPGFGGVEAVSCRVVAA